MATFLARTFAAGAIPSAPTALYIVAAALKSYIRSIWLYNNGVVQQTILLSLNINSNTRLWRSIVLEAGESASVLEGEGPLILSAGNSLIAQSTTDAVVNYSIHGVEEGA